METQSDEFHLFGGNLSTCTLWCKRCGQHVTLHGSIGETLFHAPTAMLYHWKMIEPHDEQIHRESLLMPLFLPLMKIMYDHQNLSKKVCAGCRI